MEGYIIDGTSARIINFPTVEKTLEVVEKPGKKGNYKKNYKVGEKQEVYPFRTQEDLELMYNRFVEKKQYRNALMFVIGINVGLRASDLLELKWSQIFDEDGSIANGITVKEDKTEKFRTFYLNESCKTAIIEYYNGLKKKPAKSEYVFSSRKGDGHIEVRPAGLILKNAAKAVGIKYNVGTHSMRKTFGYWQLKAHKDDALFLCHLQEMFNHSSPQITLRYCGLAEEEMEQYYNDVNLL